MQKQSFCDTDFVTFSSPEDESEVAAGSAVTELTKDEWTKSQEAILTKPTYIDEGVVYRVVALTKLPIFVSGTDMTFSTQRCESLLRDTTFHEKFPESRVRDERWRVTVLVHHS